MSHFLKIKREYSLSTYFEHINLDDVSIVNEHFTKFKMKDIKAEWISIHPSDVKGIEALKSWVENHLYNDKKQML